MSAWHYKLDDRQHGPVSFHELAALVRDGKVSKSTQVARAGTMNWEHAWRVPGLFRAAGIVEEGDSPVKGPGDPEGAPVQGSGDGSQAAAAHQGALTQALSPSEREQSWQPLRLVISAAVGMLGVGFFYRWASQAAIAFPMPPTVADGELIDCYFPVVGRCTTLECGLLYVDVFAAAAIAAWHAVGKRIS